MINIDLPEGKKIYFASDFHLGVPDEASSRAREKRIVEWLESIKKDAHTIFLMGDLFDFWFEHKYTIPKGFIRFQGKLAELVDSGIQLIFFTGNHDMWMFDYFQKELGVRIYKKPQELTVGEKKFFIHHGDGLGSPEVMYRFIKFFFNSRVCQWMFARLHPNLGFWIANTWSRKSRASNITTDEVFLGDKEWLLEFCKKNEQTAHFDYYVFGHRHLPINEKVNNNSVYINLGEWIKFDTYAVYDGLELKLLEYKS